MLTIYGSDLSWPAIKVRLTASYLGLQHTWRPVNLREGEQKQEWFLKINPVGKVPAIDDDGFYLFESNACCKYLAEKSNSPLYPKDLKRRMVVEQWIDFMSAHLGVHLSTVYYSRIFAPRMGRPVNAMALEDALKFLDMYFPVIEKQLSAHGNVAGKELTLADIILFTMLEPVEIGGLDISRYTKITAWRQALKKQPFYTACYKEYGETLTKK